MSSLLHDNNDVHVVLRVTRRRIGECVQQLGRHDNKEVHVVMT